MPSPTTPVTADHVNPTDAAAIDAAVADALAAIVAVPDLDALKATRLAQGAERPQYRAGQRLDLGSRAGLYSGSTAPTHVHPP